MASERVLVVGEDLGKRRALARCLAAAGYEVAEAHSNATAARLTGEHFDLVVGPVTGMLEQLRLQALLPLLRITETLVSETSLASIASALLERVRQDGGADVAWVAMEDDASMLETSGASHLEPRQLAELSAWLLQQRPRGLEPRSLARADLSRAEHGDGDRFGQWVAQAGWERLLIVPMAVKGRRNGAVFGAGRDDTLHAGPIDLRYLALLAAQTAIAIENARLYRRARTQSLTDSLTGLPNARFFHDHLPTMLAQARRSQRKLSLIFVDSDSLKAVNDRFGHDAGNRLVVELAETIKGGGYGVRASDIVARFTGGDEFIVLMPDTAADQAMVVAERLRAAVANHVFRSGDDAVHCTISLGVATYPDDATTPDDLVRCADAAMYEAKRLGKNRAVAYRSIAPAPATNPPPPVPVPAG